MGLAKRKFTREFKIQVCEEVESKVKTQAEVIREHSLAPSLLSGWLSEYRKNPSGCFTGREKYPVDASAAKIKELEAALGRSTYENQVLKEANALLKKSVDGEEVYQVIETLSTPPVTVSCQAMSTPYCSYYHFANTGRTVREREAIEDTLIRGEIETLINGDCSKYGYRMMTRQLKKRWVSPSWETRQLQACLEGNARKQLVV